MILTFVPPPLPPSATSVLMFGVCFMRSRWLVSALAAAAGLIALAAPAYASIVINIDKNTQQMIVAVDGAQRYVWPVSTGRPGYDTPNGVFKVNRMDADHLSQEWDNAPMPHTMFFDMHGHAIHGFFDVKHLGMPVSHGCVRLAPDNATILFNLVEAQGMKETTVVVSGQTPAYSPAVARQRAPAQAAYAPPMQLSPDYGAQPPPGYVQPQPVPRGYGAQPYYGQTPQPYYGQPVQQPYYAQQRGYYGQQPAYPAQPPPVYYVRPYGQY